MDDFESTKNKVLSLISAVIIGATYSDSAFDAGFGILHGADHFRLCLVGACIMVAMVSPLSAFNRFGVLIYAAFYGLFFAAIGAAVDISPLVINWIFRRPLDFSWKYFYIFRTMGPLVGPLVYLGMARKQLTDTSGSAPKGIVKTLVENKLIILASTLCSILGFLFGTFSEMLSKLR